MATTYEIVLAALADHDYNAGAGMHWHPSKEPTVQAQQVAARIVRDLLAAEKAEPEIRTTQPGDLCRILPNYEVEHLGCHDYADGTVTDVRNGEIIRKRR